MKLRDIEEDNQQWTHTSTMADWVSNQASMEACSTQQPKANGNSQPKTTHKKWCRLWCGRKMMG